jgi:hypothetical protein
LAAGGALFLSAVVSDAARPDRREATPHLIVYGKFVRAQPISVLRAGPPPYSLSPLVEPVGAWTAVLPIVLPTPTTRGHGSLAHQPHTAPPDWPGVKARRPGTACGPIWVSACSVVRLAAVEPAATEAGEDSGNQAEHAEDVAGVSLAQQGASPFE